MRVKLTGFRWNQILNKFFVEEGLTLRIEDYGIESKGSGEKYHLLYKNQILLEDKNNKIHYNLVVRWKLGKVAGLWAPVFDSANLIVGPGDGVLSVFPKVAIDLFLKDFINKAKEDAERKLNNPIIRNKFIKKQL